MASYLRQRLANTLWDAAEKVLSRVAAAGNNDGGLASEILAKLSWCVRIPEVNKKTSVDSLPLTIPWHALRASQLIPQTMSKEERMRLGNDILERLCIQDDHFDPEVNASGLTLHVDFQGAFERVLPEIISQQGAYGLKSHLHNYRQSPDGLTRHDAPEKIVVEYSSPNIAKPFHAGHLRSTVIGNFICNLCSALGDDVTRLNYLGDWGTQFGLLAVGFEKYGCSQKLAENPVNHLFDVYVNVNKEVAKQRGDHALDTSSTYKAAIDYFCRMENGEKDAMDFWKRCREHSVNEYTTMYKRLGVSFDEYHGEAMYHQRSLKLVEHIRDMGLLKFNSESHVGYIDLIEPDSSRPFHANLVKSNGSTLYITRDIAAALDRYDKYAFHKMYYIVENGQHAHFRQLTVALSVLGADECSRRVEHVKFGRVTGMSSRRGQVVLLTDMLDEARDRMIGVMAATKTTKVSGESEIGRVAEHLGLSALIVQDLRERRLQNYTFDWRRILNFHGDTGVFLQYTHSRLCSLERNCGVNLDVDCSLRLLTESEACRILQMLARFDEVIHRCRIELQSAYLLQYLFMLCRLLGNAFEALHVKGQPEDIAKARLLLFHCSRLTLANGLHLLGIQPLERM